MNPLIWLAMEMALLLVVAGLVFFYLGWRWRGTPAIAAAPPSEADFATSEPGEESPLIPVSAPVSPPQMLVDSVPDDIERLRTELDDAQGHRRNLERELMRRRRAGRDPQAAHDHGHDRPSVHGRRAGRDAREDDAKAAREPVADGGERGSARRSRRVAWERGR